jgi:hypothetical protein
MCNKRHLSNSIVASMTMSHCDRACIVDFWWRDPVFPMAGQRSEGRPARLPRVRRRSDRARQSRSTASARRSRAISSIRGRCRSAAGAAARSRASGAGPPRPRECQGGRGRAPAQALRADRGRQRMRWAPSRGRGAALEGRAATRCAPAGPQADAVGAAQQNE